MLNGLRCSIEVKVLEVDYNSRVIENEELVASYYKIRQQLANLASELLGYMQKPQHILPFLQPGRLVKVGVHYRAIKGKNGH